MNRLIHRLLLEFGFASFALGAVELYLFAVAGFWMYTAYAVVGLLLARWLIVRMLSHLRKPVSPRRQAPPTSGSPWGPNTNGPNPDRAWAVDEAFADYTVPVKKFPRLLAGSEFPVHTPPVRPVVLHPYGCSDHASFSNEGLSD